DIGVTAFERACHWHLGNGMALPEIFAQEYRIDAGGVAPHDYVLVIVGENLRLDEVARAEQIGDRTRFAHRTECPLAESFRIVDVCALQFFARSDGTPFAIRTAKIA